MFKYLYLLLLTLFLVGGCQTHGHRKFSVKLFGSDFVIEDQTFTDDTGQQDYQATFDEASSVVKWLFGLQNNDKSSGPAADAETAAGSEGTDTVSDGDG